MLLGIDVGNTNIVAALIDNGEVIAQCRYATAKNEKALYHKKQLDHLTSNQVVSGVIISSVVPEVNDDLKEACSELAEASPIFVSAGLDTGLDIRYDHPSKLGADLIAVAVGAVKRYGAPVIVIDIGTATTFSVINEDREYLGGMIAPGPFTSMMALASAASQLPEIESDFTDSVIGTNTIDCMKIGVFNAHSVMLDGMIEKVKDHLKLSDIRLVATGGFSEKITRMCSHKIICDQDLIFAGLYDIYKRNLNRQ